MDQRLARGMWSPRHELDRRRRTREGPEPACVQTPLVHGWHTQGRKDPWYRLVGVAKTSSETQRRKSRAARKGKWPPRGTGTTVLTYPRSAPRGTAKAGENGQHSGEVGGSSAWTRPSAPGCGDTLKALAGDQRPIQGGDRPRRRLRGRYRLGHRPVVFLRTETAQCEIRKRVGRKGAASWTLKGVAESGWVRDAGRGETAHGWTGDRPGVRLKSRTVMSR